MITTLSILLKPAWRKYPCKILSGEFVCVFLLWSLRWNSRAISFGDIRTKASVGPGKAVQLSEKAKRAQFQSRLRIRDILFWSTTNKQDHDAHNDVLDVLSQSFRCQLPRPESLVIPQNHCRLDNNSCTGCTGCTGTIQECIASSVEDPAQKCERYPLWSRSQRHLAKSKLPRNSIWDMDLKLVSMKRNKTFKRKKENIFLILATFFCKYT